MRIFNTLTNKKEDFVPIVDGQVTMYVCGPTVYNYAHMGNMLPPVIFDVIYRYLKYKGYNVIYASNFTDVDDKIIKAAIEANVAESEITEKFIKAYLEDISYLNCLDVDYRPRVTKTMDEIINFIKILLDKDYAYIVDGDVYFRVSKIKNYGQLSNQVLEDLESGVRKEIDDKKENPFDFVLWKKTSEGIKWSSPFGEGRPGWHTECVVMINKLFGDQIDIHGGGMDLKFPHHENEIAQAEAYSNTTLAKYWVHNGHLNINGEKMSKSLGNFLLARDLSKKYSGNVIRYTLISNHYRQSINLTDQLFSNAIKWEEKVTSALNKANTFIQVNNIKVPENVNILPFEEAMDDDFNTANAITYLEELIKELNIKLRSEDYNLVIPYSQINRICEILGFKFVKRQITENEKQKYLLWLQLKKDKKYVEADELRKEIIELL